MNWMLYVVLYLLLMVNGVALVSTITTIAEDRDLGDVDIVWFILAGLLTPLNLIWLVSL